MNQLLNGITLRGLLVSDRRLISRDPTLLLAISAPLLMLCVFRFGVPALQQALMTYAGFDLTPWFGLITGFVLLLQPMMSGMITGFLMLDDRDEGVLTAIAITPLSHTGYLWYRMITPIAGSALAVIVLCYGINLVSVPFYQIALLALIIGLEAPMMALFLTAFAANKVEGIALSKVGGLAIIAPAASLLLPLPYNWLGAFAPPWWVLQALQQRHSIAHFLLLITGALIMHTLVLFLMARRYTQKRG